MVVVERDRWWWWCGCGCVCVGGGGSVDLSLSTNCLEGEAAGFKLLNAWNLKCVWVCIGLEVDVWNTDMYELHVMHVFH